MRNGTESTPKGESLALKAYQDEREIHISFRNRRSGAPIREPGTLFMPFAEGGSSIGLALCHRLVRDMGGLLSFTQEANFQVFAVSLPKLQSP
jgi:two-component system, NtrC family, sensor histidine kinase HydH